MTKIYKVLSNIKHDGEDIKKDTFIEEFAGANALAHDGVLLEIEGAESISQAKEIDEERMAEAEAETPEAEQEPVDTWGPKKDEEETPEAETPEAKEEEKPTEEAPEKVETGPEVNSDNL